jgi:hypothetical protein
MVQRAGASGTFTTTDRSREISEILYGVTTPLQLNIAKSNLPICTASPYANQLHQLLCLFTT